MKKRITIDVGDKKRAVLSIWENPNNHDLNIHIAADGATYKASTLKELIATREEQAFERSDKYITIHNGTESKENNMIKRTINYESGREETAVQVTGAIKTDNLFTPVLFRVCGDLTRDRYLIPSETGDDKLYSLGSYQPDKDQLRFMVVVSNKERPFTPNDEHPSNNIELSFTNFSVTILWSYFNQPSHPQAIDFFLTTTIKSGPVAGFDWWQIYNMYTDLYIASANEYFEVHSGPV